jgi:hypothetical protein
VVRFYCCFIGSSINGVFCQDVENADDIVHRTLDICSRVLEVSFTVMLMVQWYEIWTCVSVVDGDLGDDGEVMNLRTIVIIMVVMMMVMMIMLMVVVVI